MTGRPRRTGRQPLCGTCAQRPVAMTGVAVCFGCWPSGPVTPPPCLRCGSRREYFTSGICARCHVNGRPAVDSCPDCYAWGVGRMHAWACRGCHSWRRNHPTVAACASCQRVLALGEDGACRLCSRQAIHRDEPGQVLLGLLEANRHGQQLYLADLFTTHGPKTPVPERPGATAGSAVEVAADNDFATLAASGQLTLFTIRRDLAAHGRAHLHLRCDPRLAAPLERTAQQLAREQGWSHRKSADTCLGLRIVLGLQDQPGQPINASDVTLLNDIAMPVAPVLDVLRHAGLLHEDRTPSIDRWFSTQIQGLPEPMRAELSIWFEVMKHGSTTAPRRRPRHDRTTQLHLAWALPALRAWAAAGHSSLREIDRQQVLDVLPASGNPRSTTGQGLKSICRLLKARKVLFTDPTLRIKTGQHESRQPLPVDLDLVRDGLHSTDPARAAVMSLIAFHGLRSGHLQRLQLIDLRDGKLRVDGRIIPLAEPVRERLRTYLDHRDARWPLSTNPHLFIHYRTAHTTDPVGGRWIRLHIGAGLTPAGIREDRILNEAHATGGDVRRLADLFGISINATGRYAQTLDHPDLTQRPGDQRPS